jgi:hypothetical protein
LHAAKDNEGAVFAAYAVLKDFKMWPKAEGLDARSDKVSGGLTEGVLDLSDADNTNRASVSLDHDLVGEEPGFGSTTTTESALISGWL